MKTSSEQMAMFEKADARRCVLRYVNEGNSLCDEAEVAMLGLKDFLEVYRTYIRNYSLCSVAQLKLFELPNAKELLKEYIEQNYPLCESSQAKMLGLFDAEELINIYVEKHALSPKAQIKLLKHSNAEKLLKIYVQYHYLSDEAELKMIEHEKHERFIAIYLQEHYLGEKAEVKLMETTNKEVVLQYIAKSFIIINLKMIKPFHLTRYPT